MMDKEPFDLGKFSNAVTQTGTARKDWRYGQVLFNTLHDGWPEIANKIRGSSFDPFHYEQGEAVDKFWEYLRMIEEKGDV